MRPLHFKGRCVKRSLSKCESPVRTFVKVQTAYADALERDADIYSYQCNVHLVDFGEKEMTTDFVCVKQNGEIAVRECLYRKQLLLPRMCRLLDASRAYWKRMGIFDWAIVIEEADEKNEEE